MFNSIHLAESFEFSHASLTQASLTFSSHIKTFGSSIRCWYQFRARTKIRIRVALPHHSAADTVHLYRWTLSFCLHGTPLHAQASRSVWRVRIFGRTTGEPQVDGQNTCIALVLMLDVWGWRIIQPNIVAADLAGCPHQMLNSCEVSTMKSWGFLTENPIRFNNQVQIWQFGCATTRICPTREILISSNFWLYSKT